MDAKPQRMRSIRVLGDENVQPGPRKTIHQRNKSSPALSTTAAAAGLKMAAKRTAFGDVSNTAHGTRLSKDDSIVKVREIGPAPEKAVIVSQEMRAPVILQEKKAPALSKPAQRPITVSSLKNLLTGSSTTASNDVTSKRTSTNDSNLTNQTANTRKTLTKRSTTIFKDTSLPAPVETQHAVPTVPRAPLHQILNPPPPAAAAVEPEKNRNPASQIPISDLSVEENDSLEHGLLPSQRHKQLKSDGPHLSDYQITYAQPPRSSLPQLHQPAIRSTDLVGSNVPNHTDMPNDAKVSGAASRIDTLPSRCSQILPSESEEYWDDEEDDNFAEDGYVTARSYRSRGDGTTGLGTTVLFPRCTKSVQQELAAAKQLVEATRTREDWEDEAFDTSMVAEYGDEIFTYLKELEVKMLPNAHYMDNQAEIQWSMRSVLMDWLVQVHHRFGLLPETLFLAVNYIDRFLSCKVVSIGKLQLVGATAIFIAAKYEEINCPSVQEIVYMVDGGYSIEEILKAERFMLGMLQFELGWPGPMSFLRRISKADDYDLETRTLAKYFLEITIMDERFVGSPPSFTSAGAHCLSRLILRKGIWSPSHIYYSDYTYSQLYPLLQLMLECCERPQKHHGAVFDKYCDKRFKRASIFVETEVANGFRLPPLQKDSQPMIVNPALFLDHFDAQAWLHY